MLTTQQKWEAIKALDRRASIECRDLGDFYISAEMHVADGSGVIIGKYGNGTTPEAAVEEHWDIYSNLSDDEYIAGDLRQDDGTYVHYRKRWNGFMWADIQQYELERIQRKRETNVHST